jgi:hypothetical protein
MATPAGTMEYPLYLHSSDGGPQALKIFNLQRIQRDYMLILLALGFLC